MHGQRNIKILYAIVGQSQSLKGLCNTRCSDASVWSCVLSLQPVTPFGFRRLPLSREEYRPKGCVNYQHTWLHD